MNGAYRVPGADEVLNTNLQTRGVFRFLFFLRSRHVEHLRYLTRKRYLVRDGKQLFDDESCYWVVGRFGGLKVLGVVFS